MNMELENKIKSALADIDSFKTESCLDVNTVGLYAEGKLAGSQKESIENHLHACLYCLKQLNDMSVLLHCTREASLAQHKCELETVKTLSIFERFRNFLSFSENPWRVSTAGLVATWIIFFGVKLAMNQLGAGDHLPPLQRDAFVKIQAISDTGGVIGEQQGVALQDGLIASNLSHLAGASKIRITLMNGTTKDIDRVWTDNSKNLAVMKPDGIDLKGIRTGDIKEIVGKKVYAVADPSSKDGLKEALVSDIRELSSRKRDGGARYIQVATQNVTKTKGAILDSEGKLLGFMITEEKHINLATPIEDARQLVKAGKAIPISQLKQVNFSGDAINAYMKGVLARDGQQWDEAISYLHNAIRLNPSLEGAYVELGYCYYRQQNFNKEAEAYENVLKINPQNADALYSLGWNMESQGLYEKAVPLYERALALSPADTELIYQLAISYLAQGNKKNALLMVKRLEPLDPGQAGLLKRLIK